MKKLLVFFLLLFTFASCTPEPEPTTQGYEILEMQVEARTANGYILYDSGIWDGDFYTVVSDLELDIRQTVYVKLWDDGTAEIVSVIE